MSARMQWVFFDPCGCPFGVLEARRSNGTYYTRSEAWREFFETAAERNAATDRGVVSDLVDHDIYVRDLLPMMLGDYRCPHASPAGAA